MTVRLVRTSFAPVLIRPGTTQVLAPAGRLLTFSGTDAALARRVLEDAAAGLNPSEQGAREAKIAAALLEHGALDEAPAEPPAPGERLTRLLFCVTGAADAVRAAEYVNDLVASGRYEVRVALDDEATRFVEPRGLRWLLGGPVHVGLFAGDTAVHSQLGGWAELIVVAPASTDVLHRLATGRYSSLVSLAVANSRGRVVLLAADGVDELTLAALTEEGFTVVPGDSSRPGRMAVGPRELAAVLDGSAVPSRPAETSDEPLRVVYGITGAVVGVSASAWLERLSATGFDMQVVGTAAAAEMVAVDALASVYGSDSAGHSDAVVVLPAAAEFLCRLADGDRSDRLAALAGDATTLVLVPGMNPRMWARRAVQRAVDALGERGAHVVLPGQGFPVADPAEPGGLGGIGVHPLALPGLLRLVVSRAGRL